MQGQSSATPRPPSLQSAFLTMDCHRTTMIDPARFLEAKRDCPSGQPGRGQQGSQPQNTQPLNELAHIQWGGCVGTEETLDPSGIEQPYIKACSAAPTSVKLIVQNKQRLDPFDKLFYTPVNINNTFQVQGTLDSGSMDCTVSKQAELKMVSENILSRPIPLTQEVVLVGCGGTLSKPKCTYEVEMKLCGESCIVPILMVPGLCDELIKGTKVNRFLIHQLKVTDIYWHLFSSGNVLTEWEQIVHLLANSSPLRGDELPDMIRTVKLQPSVTLLAKQEHLVWGKLPKNVPMSPGSTVIVEPTSSKFMPRNMMVGCVIRTLLVDRWIPMKITNLTDRSITLKRKSKSVKVSPCLAFGALAGFPGHQPT